MKIVIENSKMTILEKTNDIELTAELISSLCSALDNVEDITLKKILKDATIKMIKNVSTERSENIC